MGPLARRRFSAVLAVAGAVVLLLGVTVAALIGLEAECNGAGCPRSDAYRGTLLAMPLATAAVLVTGAVWSIRERTLRPLLLAEAAALGLLAVIGAVLGDAGVGTLVLLALAVAAARAGLTRRA
jgi:hypothetical protein